MCGGVPRWGRETTAHERYATPQWAATPELVRHGAPPAPPYVPPTVLSTSRHTDDAGQRAAIVHAYRSLPCPVPAATPPRRRPAASVRRVALRCQPSPRPPAARDGR